MQAPEGCGGAARGTVGTGPGAGQKCIVLVYVAALEASATVPPPVFTKDVVLYELSTGRSLDSNLQPVQATANGAPATTSPPQSSEPALRWGTLAGGMVCRARLEGLLSTSEWSHRTSFTPQASH